MRNSGIQINYRESIVYTTDTIHQNIICCVRATDEEDTKKRLDDAVKVIEKLYTYRKHDKGYRVLSGMAYMDTTGVSYIAHDTSSLKDKDYPLYSKISMFDEIPLHKDTIVFKETSL